MQNDGTLSGLPVHRTNAEALPPSIELFELEFSGSGSEFFRVWIVNLLLSAVTLGFYMPFARRRSAQYFYSHTLVADSPLEFTGQLRKMVFGFLLLAALYFAFRLAADTGQNGAVLAFLIGGAALAPYFWASAMRFRLNATRWRGVRPQFIASWREIYKASWPVFVIALAWFAAFAIIKTMLAGRYRAEPGAVHLLPGVSFWVWLLPVAAALILSFFCVIRLEFNYKSLLVSKAWIGGQRGRWKPVYRDFVRIWLATLGLFLIIVAPVLAALVAAAGAIISNWGINYFSLPLIVVFMLVSALVFLFCLLLASGPARAYREARMFRLVWSNIGVGQLARFRCNLQAQGYVLLRLKNVLLTLVTLGFYRPFAKVSEYRMKIESVTLYVKGGLDQLVGQLVRQQEAGLGDALADAVGLDLVG